MEKYKVLTSSLKYYFAVKYHMDGSSDLAAIEFISAFLGFYFLIICVALIIWALSIWLSIACIIDVAKKDEAVFKDKTLWIVLLILSFFLPFGIIIPIIYYFMYKPKMAFWK